MAAGKYLLWMGTEAICFTSLSALLSGIQKSEGDTEGSYLCVREHKTEMAHQGGREAVKKRGKFNYGDKMEQLLMETCSLRVNQSQIDCRIVFSSRDASVYADLENSCFFQ